MTLPLISMRQITKRFPGVIANNKINLELYPGEIHALLGENGSGKSTLMSILTGLYKPTEGCIMVGGEEVKFASPADAIASGIGMVHQHFKLIESFTVAENIVLSQSKGGFLLKPEQIIADIESLGEKYGLQVDPRAYVWQLGVGEKQRVEILRMLYHRSRVLILDEPTVGLDPNQIIQMRELIRDLSESHTILLSSHIMQEISAVCDEIIIINEGKMIACDTPDNLTMHMASNGLHLVIKGDVAVIKGALRTVSGIKNVVYDEQMEEGTLGLTLYSIDKKDLREDVFFALAKAECPILEMHRQETTLEEAFIALTKGGSRQFGGRKPVKKQGEAAEDNAAEDSTTAETEDNTAVEPETQEETGTVTGSEQAESQNDPEEKEEA